MNNDFSIYLAEAKKIREYLHQNPELSFQEFNTAQFVEDYLKNNIGIQNVKRIADTGVLALIEGKNKDNCIALRADIDALPISQQNDVDYKSKIDGIMHACGHDVHTTCLLMTAKLLWEAKENLPHSIKLIFQPGEEKSPGGASILLNEGILERPKVQSIIALHVHPEMKVGEIGYKAGYYMASADEIHLKLHAKGGHAAMPHLTADLITVAAQIINQLHVLCARKNNVHNPSVLSFGMIQAGNVTNVLPDTLELKGTFRTFDKTWRIEAIRLVEKTIAHICETFGATYQLTIPSGYPSLYNHPEFTNSCVKKLKETFGSENVKELSPRMTAEDFSFYAEKIPAFFFRIGTNNEKNEFHYSVHNPNFDVVPESLLVGIKAFYQLAISE